MLSERLRKSNSRRHLARVPDARQDCLSIGGATSSPLTDQHIDQAPFSTAQALSQGKRNCSGCLFFKARLALAPDRQ